MAAVPWTIELVEIFAIDVGRSEMTAESEKSGWRDSRDQDPLSQEVNSHERGIPLTPR